MPTPNQISRQRNDVEADAAALLAVPEGPRTQATLRNNIAVCIRYMAAWLGGTGCVPLYDLMEDAATAEISRAQVGEGRGRGAGGRNAGCGWGCRDGWEWGGQAVTPEPVVVNECCISCPTVSAAW